MPQIKSKKAKEYVAKFWYEQPNKQALQMAYMAGFTDAEECHAKEFRALKDKTVTLAGTARGAMILDGYELEDSCVKYMTELIDELQKLNENQ